MVAKDALVEMVSDLHTQGLVLANRLLKFQKILYDAHYH